MVPPHKDFWEVWASHFSYQDFEDPELEPEPEPEPVVARRRSTAARAVPEGEWVTVRLTIGRAHARKAADIRDLLADRTGLSGKSVRNLTVREQDTELQVAASAWPRLARAFTGAPIEGVEVAAELVPTPARAMRRGGRTSVPGTREPRRPTRRRRRARGRRRRRRAIAPEGEHDPSDAVEPAPAT